MDITRVLELSSLMLTVAAAWIVIVESGCTLTVPPLRLMLNVPPTPSLEAITRLPAQLVSYCSVTEFEVLCTMKPRPLSPSSCPSRWNAAGAGVAGAAAAHEFDRAGKAVGHDVAAGAVQSQPVGIVGQDRRRGAGGDR